MKHNKKRNTAFLYETLVKELTKAIVRKQNNTKKQVIKILRENFSNNSPLKKELTIYQSILENKHKMTDEFLIRFLQETQKDYNSLDRKTIFNSQTKLIKQINESLSNKVFANFIGNYKNIATVGQWLNCGGLNAKNRLLIESKVKEILIPKNKAQKMMHIDNLTYKTFVNKFNNTYNNSLKERQKKLLTTYITSFSNNGLELKIFMNEEIGRLKKELKECLLAENIVNNKAYLNNTTEVLEKLSSYQKEKINENMVKNIFYIQDLVEEIKNGN